MDRSTASAAPPPEGSAPARQAADETTARMWRLAILAAVLLPLALHVGIATARLLVRDLHVVIDAEAREGERRGWIYTDNGTELVFAPRGGGLLEAEVPPTAERPRASRLRVRWDRDGHRIAGAWLDDERLDASRVVGVRDAAFIDDPFYDFAIVRLPRTDGLRTIASIALPVALLLGLLALLHPVLERRRREGLPALSLLTYSAAYTAHVKRRDLAIGIAVAAATSFSLTGVDAVPAYKMIRLAAHDVDIYQWQVCHRAARHFEFPNFPYNALLLEFWTFLDRAVGPLVGEAPPVMGDFYVQIIPMKLVNAALMIGTSLALLSFAADEELLGHHARLVYYLSIFGPLVFYVAVLYVHLDPVPLYFLTLGTLFCHRFERHGLLGPLLIGVGAAMKAQALVMLPFALAAFLYNGLSQEAASRRARWLRVGLGASVSALVLGIFLVGPSRNPAPLYHLLKHFDAVSRIWHVTLAFADGALYLFFTPFAVGLVWLGYLFSLRRGLRPEVMVAISIIAGGAAIAVFNATHMYTPGALLEMASALILVMLMERDPLRQSILAGCTLLIVASYCVVDTGDITRVIPGYRGYFTQLIPTLRPGQLVRFQSVFMTLSITAMIAYALLFWGRIRALVRGGSPPR